MQPILRRIALRVQARHGLEGHVFERRYRDHPCLDPEYVRNAVVYTHINPVRAELCANPDDYRWSSQVQYGGPTAVEGGVVAPTVVRAVLGLFASRSDQTLAELASAYRRFVEWRLAFDRYLRAAVDEPSHSLQRPARPPTYAGDQYWAQHFSGGIRFPLGAGEHLRLRTPRGGARWSPTNSKVDLRDLALRVRREHGSRIDLNRIRSRYGGSEIVQLRRAIIRRAALAGHKDVEIARFLRISPAAVSRVLSAARRSHPRETG